MMRLLHIHLNLIHNIMPNPRIIILRQQYLRSLQILRQWTLAVSILVMGLHVLHLLIRSIAQGVSHEE